MLPGSLTGITYYLQPELYRLLDTQVTFERPTVFQTKHCVEAVFTPSCFFCHQVWVDAAVQIFYSVGAGFGVHLSYASYNNIKNNCYT